MFTRTITKFPAWFIFLWLLFSWLPINPQKLPLAKNFLLYGMTMVECDFDAIVHGIFM